MRRALQARLLPLGFLTLGPLVLGSCAREGDAFRPHIIITEPEAGSVSRQNSSVVRGYAIDDQEVASLVVNGTALKLPAGKRKIVPFAFKTSATSDRAEYTIAATDNAGRSAKLILPLRYDPNPPTIEITKLERDGGVLRVTGVATDDVKVASVTVDGSKLSVSPGRRVAFYAEALGTTVDVVVLDAAGNQTVKRVQ